MVENKNTEFGVVTTSITSSYTTINPSSITQEGFNSEDAAIIPNRTDQASFIPFQDIVEFWVYDENDLLLTGDNNFLDYEIIPSPLPNGVDQDGNSTELSLNPIQDTINYGYDIGNVNVIYNFLNYALGTSVNTGENTQNQYYISEISQDRTEIRLKTNYLSNDEIRGYYTDFKTIINTSPFADEFYLNFGENQLVIAVNCLLDDTADEFNILIKLYQPLPPQFSVKDTISVVTKPAESLGYSVSHPPLTEDNLSNVIYLKGPNYNLKINDFTNNSTNLQTQNELLNTESTSSKNELINKLNQKGITLSPDYSYDTFNEFVNFSSAKKRVENFIEKVTQIQAYEADIASINNISSPSLETPQVSSSIASAETNIQTIIKNFDGYEYFLYYGTGSSSYPKTGSSYPYELLPTTNPSVSAWLGSDVDNSQYYGGIILSASLYDNSNQNWLYYTIPEFIRDDSNNNQYLEFSNMVGQSFDEVWLYTKAVTKKLNTTNNIVDGVPLGLADDVIASLGYDGFGSNFNNQDNFIGLTGENNGIYVPPTGSELITNYIAVNGGQILNYWDVGYSYEDYVASLTDPGYPYAIDKVSKEIFKRLYHNMSYLVKKKGTIAGLRQLINIWGIPNTILRINEFGGKDKDNSDDYDLWYNRYSYAFTPVSTQNVASASVAFPWMPLERNRIAESEYIVPDSFQFRFKTTGYPSSSYAGEFFTQSLAVKKSDGDDTSTDFDFGISLFYEPVVTGSYSGSASSEYENWGKMRFHISGAAADGGVATSNDIYLPFFDKGWWTVMLQRNQHVSASDNTNATTYTLYAKNKIYNGWDGAQIGFEGSASITSDVSESINEAWNKFGVTAADGIYLGGFVSGSNVGGITTGLPGKIFSGSLQEFRYYSNDIPEATFNDFVMNPESIEGNSITGSQSSFDIVNFRAPLGNELENVFTSSQSSSYTDVLTSMHPSITGSANIVITGSFVNPTGNVTSSEYRVLYYENSTTRTFSKTNTEVYFLDQPAIGFRNRISDKIQIRDGDDYGTILSNRISIQQDYQISQSYTENINSLEVAFSPQDEVNDDIIASFGYGVIADTIADPRFVSSSEDYYPELRKTAEDYFQKYTKGNVYDYLRLIKYFDNSIFKAIKSYVPARTSVSTGIVIKQHMLERNRFQPVQITEGTQVATTPSGALNTPIIMENIILSQSIDLTKDYVLPTGSTGGSANKFNYVDSSFLVDSGSNQGNPHNTPFGKIVNTQSYEITNNTVLGAVEETINQQDEFYDGEFSGSEFIATTQSLFYNPFTQPNTTEAIYNTDVVLTSFSQSIQSFDSLSSNDYVRLALGHMYMPTASICIITGSKGKELYPGAGIFPTSIEEFQAYANQGFNNNLGSTFANNDDNPIIIGLWNDKGYGNLGPGENYLWYVAYTIIPDYHNYDLIPGIQDRYTFSLPTPFTNPSVVYGVEGGGNVAKNPTPEGVSWPYEYHNNQLTPYFRIDIGECFNSSSFGESVEDPGFGNLSTYILDSSAFAPRTAVAKAELPRNVNLNQDLQGEGLYQFFGNNENYTEGRPFVMSDTTGAGDWLALTASYIWWSGDSTSLNGHDSLGNPIPNTTSSLNNRYVLNNVLTAQNQALIHLGSNIPSEGSASLYSFPVKYTQSIIPPGTPSSTPGTEIFYSGSGYSVPILFSVNEVSSGSVNNQPSFNESPTISFTLTSSDASLVVPSSASTQIDTDELTISSFPSIQGTYNLALNPISSRQNIGEQNFYLVGNTPLYIFDPFILPLEGINIFENSIYYATPNNYNANRLNQYRYIVENQYGINTISNLQQIASGSAQKAQVPDSNYTAKKVTIPRYSGSKVISANYNTYAGETVGSNTVEYANGETGSWGGDSSYGKTSAIDKYPRYIAHFEQSKNNFEKAGTYTFNIDKLIEIPQRNITEESLTVNPKSIKIDGSNKNLLATTNTFEKGRKATIAYGTKQIPSAVLEVKTDKDGSNPVSVSSSVVVDYSSLKIGNSEIFQGGLEYQTTYTTQRTLRNYTISSSFATANNNSIIFPKAALGGAAGFPTASDPQGDELIGYLTGSSAPLGSGNEYGKTYWASTGSGFIQLEGPATNISMSLGLQVSSSQTSRSVNKIYYGNLLSVLHTWNYWVENQIENGYPLYPGSGPVPPSQPENFDQPGLPYDISFPNRVLVSPGDNDNYFRFNTSSSRAGATLSAYEDFDLNFLAERGDEIRVTYNVSDDISVQTLITQDFQVLDAVNHSESFTRQMQFFSTSSAPNPVSGSNLYDRIAVTPDPSTLDIPIPNGEIYQFTLRKRVNADDRVIVYQTPPFKSYGIQTKTGDGYLIPEDLSESQKNNVQTIINQLQSQNAVPPSSKDTGGGGFASS